MDGLFCEYSEAEKFQFFQKLFDIGVKNIEMECTAFASFTYRAGIPGNICTYINI